MICFYIIGQKIIKAYDKGEDYQVIITEKDNPISERWFSVWQSAPIEALYHAMKSTIEQELNTAFDKNKIVVCR